MSEVLDLEQSLLGLALTGNANIDELAAIVDDSDFYSPANGLVWRAVLQVHETGVAPDPITVRDMLAKIASGARIDPMLLTDAVGVAPVSLNGDWYATQVREAAQRRRLVSASITIRQVAESDAISIDAAQTQARQAVDDATAGRLRSELVRVSDVLQVVIDNAEKDTSPALPTGWDDLDRLIGGLAPGRLVVIGARPGVGKSIAGTNLALQFAGVHKHAVLIASMEMNREEVVQRMISAHAGVNVSRLADGTLTEEEWSRIGRQFTEMNDLPVFVLDDPVMTVASIRAKAREIRRLHPDLALIVVDYLQLMDTGVKTNNRVEALGQISRGLKVLARETNTCVVAMAQLNRESIRHSDGRPKMSDLRESGSIEADANVVILMHRPDEETPEVEAIVDKNRHGPKGIATLLVEGHYSRLVSNRWSPTRSVGE